MEVAAGHLFEAIGGVRYNDRPDMVQLTAHDLTKAKLASLIGATDMDTS